jgi:hypothetical protein
LMVAQARLHLCHFLLHLVVWKVLLQALLWL